jgi:drug/metabolite transporter (DMT)-like permease
MTPAVLLLLLAYVFLETTAHVSFKLGAMRTPPSSSGLTSPGDFASTVWVRVGLLCMAANFLVWLGVLARLDLSVAFPLSSAAFVAIMAASTFLLGEPVGGKRLAGAALILIGIALVSRSQAPGHQEAP